MPKLEYPAFFNGDIIGTRCRDNIMHNEAFLFVPYKMVITVNKVRNTEILKPIFEENPKIFTNEPKGIELVLTMGLLY